MSLNLKVTSDTQTIPRALHILYQNGSVQNLSSVFHGKSGFQKLIRLILIGYNEGNNLFKEIKDTFLKQAKSNQKSNQYPC